MTKWQMLEQMLRAELTAAINDDPRSLLDTAGGPTGLKAGWILATLLGFEDEVDAPGWVERGEVLWPDKGRLTP